jgi:hypothetical protein
MDARNGVSTLAVERVRHGKFDDTARSIAGEDLPVQAPELLLDALMYFYRVFLALDRGVGRFRVRA